MIRRLPVSLRFDDSDTEFYCEFIEKKKNNRELSTLILDLLHVYHEDEEVQKKVDNYSVNQSPYLHIHEELQRIALEHNRQSISTSMLGDYTENERRRATRTEKKVNNAANVRPMDLEDEEDEFVDTSSTDSSQVQNDVKMLSQGSTQKETTSQTQHVVSPEVAAELQALKEERDSMRQELNGFRQMIGMFTQQMSSMFTMPQMAMAGVPFVPQSSFVNPGSTIPASSVPMSGVSSIPVTEPVNTAPGIVVPEPPIQEPQEVPSEPIPAPVGMEIPPIEQLETKPSNVERSAPKTGKKPASFSKLMNSMS